MAKEYVVCDPAHIVASFRFQSYEYVVTRPSPDEPWRVWRLELDNHGGGILAREVDMRFVRYKTERDESQQPRYGTGFGKCYMCGEYKPVAMAKGHTGQICEKCVTSHTR